jgi:hypothetical protein
MFFLLVIEDVAPVEEVFDLAQRLKNKVDIIMVVQHFKGPVDGNHRLLYHGRPDDHDAKPLFVGEFGIFFRGNLFQAVAFQALHHKSQGILFRRRPVVLVD